MGWDGESPPPLPDIRGIKKKGGETEQNPRTRVLALQVGEHYPWLKVPLVEPYREVRSVLLNKI